MKLLKRPRQNNLVIPVNLAVNVVRKKLISQFKLFAYLKIHSSGIFENEYGLAGKLALELKVSRNTIKNWISCLIQLDWIGYDRITNLYYIRSFDRLCKLEDIKSKYGVVFSVSKFEKFEGFISAIPYAYLHNVKIKRDQGWAVHLRGNTFQPTRNLSSYVPIAINAVAKYYLISATRAHSLRKIAEKNGFLKIAPNFKLLNETTFFKIHLIKQYEEAIIGKNIFIKKGQTFARFPDLVLSNIQFTKR